MNFLDYPEKFVELIRRDYENAVLCPFPWCEEELQMEFSEIFTRLKIVYRQKERARLTKDSVKMKDVFTPHERCKKPRVVLIEGLPGMGKTTYCQKLGYDWSVKDIALEASFPKVDVLLRLACRDMKTANIVDAIKEQLLPLDADEKERENFFHFINRNQSRILLVLDGLDELPQHLFEGLLLLIKGKVFPNTYLLLTARHEAGMEVRKYCNTLLEIVGYTSKDANSYIKKYFSNHVDPNLAKKLICRLKRDKKLRELSANPLNTALLCLVCEDLRGIFPNNRTLLYDELVSCVLRRYFSRKKINGGTKSPIEENSDWLNQLGEFALDALLKDQLAFTPEGLESQPTEFLELGFLSREASASKMKPKATYAFIHKTFQEYFAAFHLATAGSDKVALLAQLSPVDKYWQVWEFLITMAATKNVDLSVLVVSSVCAAYQENKSSRFFSSLREQQTEYSDDDSSEYSDDDSSDIEEEESSGTGSRSDYEEYYRSESGQDDDDDDSSSKGGDESENSSADIKPVCEDASHDFVESARNSYMPIHDSSDIKEEESSGTGARSDYEEDYCSESGQDDDDDDSSSKGGEESENSSADIKPVCEDASHDFVESARNSYMPIHDSSDIKEEESSGTGARSDYEEDYCSESGQDDDDDDSSSKGSDEIENSSDDFELVCEDASHDWVESARNSYIPIFDTEIYFLVCIIHIIAQSEKSESELSQNQIEMAATLARCLPLKKMAMYPYDIECLRTLNQQCVLVLSEYLKSDDKRKDFAWYASSSVSLRPLTRHKLKSSHKLTHLYLLNGLRNSKLVSALQKNRTVTHLRLTSAGTCGPIGAEALCGVLKENHSLTHLCLGHNNLTNIEAEALTQGLLSNSVLVYLNLSMNNIGNQGIVALSKALKSNRMLSYLDISYQRVKSEFQGDEGAKALADALRSNNSLTHLDFRANPFTDSAAAELGEALQLNSSLTNLYLRNDYFSSALFGNAAATAFSMALQSPPTKLTRLDLHSTSISSSCAETLAEALRINRTLERLDLSYNKIECSGAIALAQALKSNQALRYLQLSNNKIGDSGVKEFLEALKCNETLLRLNLATNPITASGCKLLNEFYRHSVSKNLKIMWSLVFE